tara:strand:- start:167 stop:514 length:348 start_codon:yes stop_codon:yes gene_type:complete
VRVKLSYTVEVENVLNEVSNLLALQTDEVEAIATHHRVLQQDLCREDPDVYKALDRLEELRGSLFNVDTRAAEIVEILKGYNGYKATLYTNEQSAPAAEEDLEPENATEEQDVDA